jgi:hypothetical protein
LFISADDARTGATGTNEKWKLLCDENCGTKKLLEGSFFGRINERIKPKNLWKAKKGWGEVISYQPIRKNDQPTVVELHKAIRRDTERRVQRLL